MPTTRKLSGKAKAKLVAKLTAKARALTARELIEKEKAKALHGKSDLDGLVADFLEAVYAGRYPLIGEHHGEPRFNDEGEPVGVDYDLMTLGPDRSQDEFAKQLLFPPALVGRMLFWILVGNHKALVNLTNSVKRVHSRLEIEGDALTFRPANPDLATAVSVALEGGKSGEEIAERTHYTSRHGRRIAKKLGIPPKATKWQH